METVSRARFALRWALGHLGVSLFVAALAALLVFGVWYPEPWRQLLGVAGIFGLVVAVDVVCGPLLTLVLASPKKSLRERWVDISLVSAIQLLALAYGLSSVFGARPVAVIFEVDRLVVVTANEVQTERLGEAPEDLQELPWFGVNYLSLRKPASPDEFLQSVDESLQGVTQAMRPGWWRPFEEGRAALVAKSQPLSTLLAKRPAQQEDLIEAAQKSGKAPSDLRFLPLTSSKHTDWVALLSINGDVVGFAPVDGFDD
jgi:hypothetical protein